MAALDLFLLLAGVILPLILVISVFVAPQRYPSWVRIVASLVGIAAVAWGATEAIILYHPLLRSTLSELKVLRRLLAIVCICCTAIMFAGRRRAR